MNASTPRVAGGHDFAIFKFTLPDGKEMFQARVCMIGKDEETTRAVDADFSRLQGGPVASQAFEANSARDAVQISRCHWPKAVTSCRVAHFLGLITYAGSRI